MKPKYVIPLIKIASKLNIMIPFPIIWHALPLVRPLVLIWLQLPDTPLLLLPRNNNILDWTFLFSWNLRWWSWSSATGVLIKLCIFESYCSPLYRNVEADGQYPFPAFLHIPHILHGHAQTIIMMMRLADVQFPGIGSNMAGI